MNLIALLGLFRFFEALIIDRVVADIVILGSLLKIGRASGCRHLSVVSNHIHLGEGALAERARFRLLLRRHVVLSITTRIESATARFCFLLISLRGKFLLKTLLSLFKLLEGEGRSVVFRLITRARSSITG